MQWEQALIHTGNEFACNRQTRILSIILWNREKSKFIIRCDGVSRNGVDRLLCKFIDDTGNLLKFDEMTTKEIVISIKKYNEKQITDSNNSPKDVMLYNHFGVVKVLLKQKTYWKKQKEKTRDYKVYRKNAFSIMVKKLKTFLSDRMMILNKLHQTLLPKTLSLSGTMTKFQKQIKKLEIKLHKRIQNILREKSGQITTKKQVLPKTGTGTGIGQLDKSNVYRIQTIQLKDGVLKTHAGGSSDVEKRETKSILYYDKDNNKIKRSKMLLALKKPKDEDFAVKFQRQEKIIDKINKEGGKKDYLLNYYKYKKENNQTIYLDYYDLNLNEFLYYYREFLTIQEVFSLCKQILLIVIDLHKNGIVYRDLKPSNFLVDLRGQLILKLIDFSDSCYIGQNPSEIGNLCGTLPYSPIQTSRHSDRYEREGIKNQRIDYWSVGMLIHEIFYGYFPLTYSSGLAKDILNLWSNEFLYLAKMGKKSGLKVIDSAFQLLNLAMVRVNQSERLEPTKAYEIIIAVEEFYREVKKLIIAN